MCRSEKAASAKQEVNRLLHRIEKKLDHEPQKAAAHVGYASSQRILLSLPAFYAQWGLCNDMSSVRPSV